MIFVLMIGKVYVNSCMQVTINGNWIANFNGLLKDLNGILMVPKNKWEYLWSDILATLVQSTERRRGEIVNGLEGLVKTALFLITAIQGDSFYRIVCFQ